MSLVDVAGEGITYTRQFGKVVDGIELVLLPEMEHYYGVEDPAEQAWMRERLTGHPWKCFEQPLQLANEDRLWAIPQYHVVCTSTLANREHLYPEMMATARAEGRLWDIDTGHDLMLTEPQFVAMVLQEIVGT